MGDSCLKKVHQTDVLLMDNSRHNIIFRINRGRFMLENGLSKLFFSLWIIASITLSLGIIEGDLCLRMVHQTDVSPYG